MKKIFKTRLRMKKKQREALMTKASALVLSGVMLLTLLPALFAVQSSAAESDTSVLDMFDSSEPVEYKKNVNPYGYAQGESFMMSPQNELLLLSSYNRNDSANAKLSNKWYSGYTKASNPMSAIDHSSYSPFESSGSYGSNQAFAYTEAVAFDPFGTGRDDHVAYLAMLNDGTVITYVMDVNTGACTTEWGIGDASHLVDIQNYEAGNFFSITAGNYSTDKGETFVVYAPLANGENKLVEYRVEKNAGSSGGLSLKKLSENTSYFHEVFTQEGEVDGFMGKTLSSDGNPRNMLMVDLATGDVNGDKMDDLIVLSYYTNVTGYDDLHIKHFSPQMRIAKGGGSGTILGRTANVKDKLFRKGYSGKFLTMNAPTVTAGDVNGDGIDEIVVGGWMRLLHKQRYNQELLDKYEEKVGVTVAVFEYTGYHIQTLLFQEYDQVEVEDPLLNVWSQGTAEKNKDLNIMPPYVVECVAIDGQSDSEHIFLNGTFARFEGNQVVYKFTPQFFITPMMSLDMMAAVGTTVDIGFIDSTAVGVFDNNGVGREQIIMSVGMKELGEDDYYYALGTMFGRAYDDIVKTDSQGRDITVKYGTAHGYFGTRFWLDNRLEENYNGGWGCFIRNKGSKTNQRLNFLVVAIDRGTDGTVARYASKGYEFSNPNVVSVLQAAPYFGELSSYGDSATEYSITTSYVIGEQDATSTSFSIGASFETEMPGFKFSLGTGYTCGFSQSFENAFSEEHTTTFTAKNENQVVLQRTPIIIYNYDVQDASGNFTQTVQVTVPGAPSYALLTVEEYNKFVGDYNAAAGITRYKTITDARLLGNAGNPEKYASEWGSGAKQLSASVYSVNSTSGSITSSYVGGSEDTTSITTSQGYYMDMQIGVGGSYIVGSTYGGVETSLEGETSHGSFTTTGEYRGASGTVYGLGDLKEEIPTDILSQFGFNWSFGTWNVDIEEGHNVPVYGYAVSGISRAVAAPASLMIEDTADVNIMSVTFDTTVSGATDYNIYMFDENGKWRLLQTVDAPTSETSKTMNVEFPSDHRDNSITLAVNAVVDGKPTAMTSPVTYFKQNTVLSAYQIACLNGFTGTEAEWLASLVGKDGVDGKDGVGIEKIHVDAITGDLMIRLTNGEEMNLGSITPEDGIDGSTPYVGENGNWWIGETDTGVKAQGAQGQQGIQGEQGAQGIQGIQGEQGAQGIQGIQGEQGAQGIQGIQGEQGAQGIQGIQGEQGAQGDQGVQGEQGIQGEKGESGEAGKDGKDGKDGIGIASAAFDENGDLILTFTDNSTVNAGSVKISDSVESEGCGSAVGAPSIAIILCAMIGTFAILKRRRN